MPALNGNELSLTLRCGRLNLPYVISTTGTCALTAAGVAALAAPVQSRYYGHSAVHDRQGVIAPWYTGLNGQCDFRVRVAAETLKRYPRTTCTNAIVAYPAYVFTGFWQISSNGVRV